MSRKGIVPGLPAIGKMRGISETETGVDAAARRRIDLGGIAANVDEVREIGSPRRMHADQPLRAQRLG